MTNTPSSQPFQIFIRLATAWLPRVISGGNQLAPVCQKAPPRLSLHQSFLETAGRRTGPNLSWLQGDL